MTREPLVVRFDSRARTLTFRDVLPAIGRHSVVRADVEALVERIQSAAVPPHRRIDRRRMSVACILRRRRLSIVVTVRGRRAEYGVQRGVNLVHELFVLLQAAHPEYLWEAFGLPSE